MTDKKKQGKKNRAAGSRFELKVRKDLEDKGWICSKWMNNVSDFPESNINLPSDEREDREMIPAKHKFRGPGIPMAIGTGFPDFIAFRPVLDKFSKYKSLIPLVEIGRENLINDMENEVKEIYEIIGIECKSNGYLTKEEKDKCKWLLDNHTFSRILIASKGKKRGEIRYQNV